MTKRIDKLELSISSDALAIVAKHIFNVVHIWSQTIATYYVNKAELRFCAVAF